MLTHYVPAFAHVAGVRVVAVCETPVFPNQHAIEPTCPVCVEWLKRVGDGPVPADAEASVLR